MKKIYGILVIIVFACGIVSCKNSKTAESQQKENDSTNVEEIIDTISSTRGFGRCLESGCYCKEFKGRGQTCGNCGHAYKRHY